MLDPNLLKNINVSDEELNLQLKEAFGDDHDGDVMAKAVTDDLGEFKPDSIIKSRVLKIADRSGRWSDVGAEDRRPRHRRLPGSA